MATTQTPTAHLTSTIKLLEKHVKDQSTTGVANSLGSWIETLKQHKELKGIADDLESLKTAISDKNGQKIASLMEKLGHETVKAAEGAEGAEATKISALGKALLTSSKALSKLVK